jgi:hypothetical protein
MDVVSSPFLTSILFSLVAMDLAHMTFRQRGCLHFLSLQRLAHDMDPSSNWKFYQKALGH